jgi:hypothetical protein
MRHQMLQFLIHIQRGHLLLPEDPNNIFHLPTLAWTSSHFGVFLSVNLTITSNNVESVNNHVSLFQKLPIMDMLLEVEKMVVTNWVKCKKCLQLWDTPVKAILSAPYLIPQQITNH